MFDLRQLDFSLISWVLVDISVSPDRVLRGFFPQIILSELYHSKYRSDLHPFSVILFEVWNPRRIFSRSIYGICGL